MAAGIRRGARFRSGAIGVLIALGVLSFLFVALNAPKGLPFAAHTFRSVAVTDVGDLTVGNDVRVAQVRVGRVDDIALVGGVPVVRMQLDEVDSPVYRDGTAAVVGRSGLGQQYLDLLPGTPAAGELGEDDVLPVERSRGAVQLLDLAGTFDPATQDAAKIALGQFGGGTTGHGQDLQDFLRSAPGALPSLGTVSTSLATDDGKDLTSMLTSLDSLSSRFSGREQEIGELLGRLDTTLAAVATDNGDPLRQTLDVAPETMIAVRTALGDLRTPLADTAAALDTLEPGTAALGQATPDVRGVLQEAPGPLSKVPGVADQATPAIEDLTPAVADARPVAAKLTEGVHAAADPLQVLAPYSPEIAQWFTNASSALYDGDAAGHWLRFTLLPRTESVTGAAGIEDPLRKGDAYPGPGETPKQAEGALPLPLPTDGGGN